MRSITMSRVLLSGALALGALGAIAGFTPGVATADAAPSVSPFAGNWSGTWSVAADEPHDGDFDWTISNAGRLSGRVYHAQDGMGGAIVGHVRADGYLVFVGFTPADDPLHGNGYHFDGTVVIDRDGKLVVSATWTATGAPLVATLVRE